MQHTMTPGMADPADLADLTARGAQSDLELVVAARAGDQRARAALLIRHGDAVAGLGPSPFFASVEESGRAALDALRDGSDRDLPFRAVWLSVHQRGSVPETPVAHSSVWGAFGSLPPAWRLAVWHREVEGMRPAEIARHLDMGEQQTTRALGSAYAALRRRVALAHPPTSSLPECQDLSDAYRFSPPASLSSREVRSLREHGRHCDACLGLIRDLFTIEHALRDVLAAVVLGEAASTYLAGKPKVARLRLAGADPAERPQRKVHPLLGTISAAGVGAAAMALVLSTPAVSPVRDDVPRAIEANVPAPGTLMWPDAARVAPGVVALAPASYSPTAVDAAFTPGAGSPGGHPGHSGHAGHPVTGTEGPGQEPGVVVPETPDPEVDPAPEPTELLDVEVVVTQEEAVVSVASNPGPSAPIEVEVPLPEVPLEEPLADTTDEVTGGLIP